MAEIKIPDGFEHNCNNCQGLCCVALAIDKKSGFPKDKEAGVPCDQLNTDASDTATLCKCNIYKTLDDGSHNICPDFTCLGAGNTVSKYFQELGIHWAMRPENIDDSQWALMKNNIFNAYLIFHNIFLYLYRIRNQRHPNNKIRYDAARKSVEKVSRELAGVLETGAEEVDYENWYENKFKPEMQISMHDADSAYLLNKLGKVKWW